MAVIPSSLLQTILSAPSKPIQSLYVLPFPSRHTHFTVSVPVSGLRYYQSGKGEVLMRAKLVRSQIRSSIIGPEEDHWGTWTALFAIGAFGLWDADRTVKAQTLGFLLAVRRR